MTAPAAQQRYTAVAIALHWLIAAGIVGMIALGWIMGDMAPGPQRYDLFQLHKSIGITILLLTLARIVWRIMNPPPPEPPMPAWQALLAKAVHVGFYVLMLAMPLSGWIMASADVSGIPTVLYKTLPWPHVPGLAELPRETKETLHGPLEFVHSKLAWVAIGLLVLHVAGALKHQFADKDGLLARMAPGLFGRTKGPPRPGRGLVYAAAVAAVTLAAASTFAMRAPEAAVATEAVDTADLDPQIQQTPASGGSPEQAQQPPQGPGPLPDQTPVQAPSPVWIVDHAQSTLGFKGGYMGRPFAGKFSDWTASIRFDPANPQAARIRVAVKTRSISTGEPYFDENVTQGDWLDAAKHPEATFTVDEGGVLKSGDTFTALGAFNIRGQDHPLRLPFTLTITGDTAKMHAEVTLKRLDLAVGRDTLAEAKGDEEWVANDVGLVIDVVAKRQP